MKSYLQNSLQPNEEVKYIAKIHFYFFVQPAVLLLLGYWFYDTQTNISHYSGLLLLFWGVVSLVQRVLVKVGSIYAVTNKRVILKTGIIGRSVVELVLAKCEGLHIEQSVLGRIFGFGTIIVTTGGATNCYHYVAKPFRFKREINVLIG
jgi:Predicted membrane protein